MAWFCLVGFMGAGKTTLGADLASRLSLPFVDLDEEITKRAGASVIDVFEREGESGFRRRETAALREVLGAGGDGVLAVGGGGFIREENRELIHAAGYSVWIDVPFDVLRARVDPSDRPLWTDPDAARRLARARRKYYRLANFHLEIGSEPIQDGATRLYRLLAPHHGGPRR